MTGTAGYTPGRDPDAAHASRAAPLAESICWRPTDGEATGPGAQQYPIYVRQRALAALHDHFRGSATQGILGFLVGALLEDPSTRERWLELEFIVRLTQPIYGDKTTLVISRVWERLQQEVGRTGGHMLGWYHSHPPLGTEIAPGDIEAHEQYFGRPWQIALVLGLTAKGPSGAFYRPSAGLPLGTTPLPFFEIVARDSITPEGRKRTRVTWKNYRPDLRRTSSAVTGVSAVLQALQAAPRPPEPGSAPPPPPAPAPVPAAAVPAPATAVAAVPPPPPPPPRPPAPAPQSPAVAVTPTPAPVAAAEAPPAVAAPAARYRGRINTPPRGSGAIRVAAVTSPRSAEPPLLPAARVSGVIEKAPEPPVFTPPVPTPPVPAPEPMPVAAAPLPVAPAAAVPPPVVLADTPPPAPSAPAASEPARPRPPHPAIAGLPIFEPPARASVPVPVAAPASAPEPAPAPAAPAPAHTPSLRPSVQSAGGVDILRALPATQTPAERPAVGAAPLARPSRDRPTSEVLQELADAITRAARTSGTVRVIDGPGGRATTPRRMPPGAMVEAARQALEPVTFTPAEEPPARRPSPPERQSRESAVTFTPTPSVEPPAPLEPAFAPKRPGRDVEVEVLPDALRSTRPAATPAAAPRPSRVQRRTFGSGLQAEPEPVASVVRWPYVLALVAAVGAAVYWYAFRPRTVFVPVAQQTATEPVDSTPPQGAAAPVESLAVEPPPAPAPVDSAPVRPPVPAADALTPLDLLVDSLDAVIFQYLDRAAAFDAGQRDCQLLSAALVGVDRLWVAYNAQRRRLDAPLDSLRTLRDQAAYANVEAVDTHFGRSGCPRP